MLQQALSTFLVFAEPAFPTHGVPAKLPEIAKAVVCSSVEELSKKLKPASVLVWRHGSTFPAKLWPRFVEFLEAGGSFLYLGGEPFTRVVVGEPGQRKVQARTVSLLKELRLNQCHVVDASGAHGGEIPRMKVLPQGARVAILEPRFADTKDVAHEDGSPGARDAILRPFSELFRGTERYPFATPSYAIDRMRGRFAGGRWTFWLLSTKPSNLAELLEWSGRPPVDFRLDPTYGCFHEGERPSLVIRVHRPRASGVDRIEVKLTHLSGPGIGASRQTNISHWMRVGKHGTKTITPVKDAKPGLYKVVAECGGNWHTTGFWVMDKKLFESGQEITFDGYTMRRGDVPEPVLGTTVMSRSVHRKFLFEPNAAEWDDTFRELRDGNINLVRTGIWSAYRKFSLHPNAIDESFLRALEAYYLSARKHGIPVIFTFFAFLPETFGGKNPYLDPRAVEGQRAYLSAVASRFVNTREMLWDLINEPSYSNPKQLWKCRPNGDAFEKKAFLTWLEKRYGENWKDEVRSRWRLLPDQEIGLPTLKDFEERHLFEEHRPYRAKEFSHFAQDAFAGWIDEMSKAIREAGSKASITVGQDEGGLYDRPSPLTHHDHVAYTSLHTWWNNDAQLWDCLLAKARDKPLLISETGIMGRERLSGESIRTPESSADLLSRKIGYSFAAGAFGVVQWCYDTNPYLAIDNEAAIGLRRVDGSYKPEHAVMREFASFLARNKKRFENPKEPDLVMVMPHGDHYSPRGMQTSSTRRVVQIVAEELGTPMRIVSEYRTAKDLGQPKWIVLPACRGISDGAWKDILAAVDKGAQLLCSGYIEADDAGRSTPRVQPFTKKLERRTLALVEGDLRYTADVTESASAASQGGTYRHGKGRIRHHQTPLEWSVSRSAQARAYAAFIGENQGPKGPAGVTTRLLRFRNAFLLIAVNERSTPAVVPASKWTPEVVVPARRAGMFLLDAKQAVIDQSSR